MKFGLFSLSLTPYFDIEGGGGAPAAPAPPAPGGNGAPAPSAPVGTPAAPVAPAPPQFSYKEDRSNWVPSHVVRQATEKQREIEGRLRYEQERVAALSGVKPPPQPEDAENAAIKAHFDKLYPGFNKLMAMQEKLEKLTNFDFDGIQKSQEQQWVAHGNQVLQTLATKVQAAYGGAELSPKALQRISHAFASDIQNDPDTRARYEAGDMSIIDEFVKDYTGAILDPYRRSTAAAQSPGNLAARRLPRGGGSSAIVGARPAALKPSDPGFHEAAFRRFSEGQG